MQLEKFDFNNMNFLVDRVKDLWSAPDSEDSFRRIYAEQVIRMDMHENNYQFQICENNELRAIACASRKGDKVSSENWWNAQYEKLSSEQQFSFKLSREYLSMMDKKAYSFMGENDIKLDLFISTKTGWGKKILEPVMEYFKQQGFKNLYLWTDCECNVDWYFDHGYELVEEDVYEPFSRENENYKTYIFKKEITK